MDQLRHKLFDFTEAPPLRVWTAVESALDQDMPAISKKLSAYIAAPPSGLWEKIESGLEEKSAPPKVIPFYKRTFVRLAAAAVLLFGVFQVIGIFTPSGKNDQITSAPPASPASTPPAAEANGDTQLPAVVPLKVPAVRKRGTKLPEEIVQASIPTATKKARYTTMSNDEGQTVRLSKKVAPVFDCAGARIKTISSRCKEDIKALQEKIGASFTSPSADFSGLIDMLKSLEDDQ